MQKACPGRVGPNLKGGLQTGGGRETEGVLLPEGHRYLLGRLWRCEPRATALCCGWEQSTFLTKRRWVPSNSMKELFSRARLKPPVPLSSSGFLLLFLLPHCGPFQGWQKVTGTQVGPRGTHQGRTAPSPWSRGGQWALFWVGTAQAMKSRLWEAVTARRTFFYSSQDHL